MKAASYQEVEPAKRVLRLGEHSIPEVPSGGVLVKVWASGVNPSDVKRRAGWLNALMEYPEVIPHSDGAGVIIAVGEKSQRRGWTNGFGYKGVSIEFVQVYLLSTNERLAAVTHLN
jgi:NADPH:quinone reductase-like Zn-dependent oxidoreductase